VHADNASTVFSEPADAPTGDAGGDNAKEEFPDFAGPWLDARFQNRCALGFGVHVMRGTLDENAPHFSCGPVDVVDLESHLVLGAMVCQITGGWLADALGRRPSLTLDMLANGASLMTSSRWTSTSPTPWMTAAHPGDLLATDDRVLR
jgi:hypothetical protein